MPGTNTSAIPITTYKIKGNQNALPQIKWILAHSGNIYNRGVPVALSSGYLIESPTLSAAFTIVGFSCQAGTNLLASGVAPVGGSGYTYGSVPNQPQAVNIAIGSPMADGTEGVFVADENTIFQGVVDSGHTVAITDLGQLYGLTKDTTTNNWFVDTTIITAATGGIVEITDVPTTSVGVVGGVVGFRITRAGQEFGI